MTITPFWRAGLEVDGSNSHNQEFDQVYLDGGVITSPASGHSGTRALSVSVPEGGLHTSMGWVRKNLPSGCRQYRNGYFVYPQQVLNSGGASGYERSVVIYDAGANVLSELRHVNSGALQLYVGGTLRATYNGYLVARWQHVGIDLKIDASGWVAVYIDGVQQLLYEGNTGAVDVSYMTWGIQDSGITYSRAATLFDDFYIDLSAGEAGPAVLPGKTLPWVPFTADGNYKQWTPSTGSDHYAVIDDVPHNADTDYNSTGAVDSIDTFTHPPITLAPGESIVAVLPTAIERKLDTTNTQTKGFARLSGVDLEGTAMDMTLGYAPVQHRLETKPGGGAWTEADFNNAELGFKSAGTI